MLVVSNSVFVLILTTTGVYCGLLTGDLKLKSRPFTINSHHAPIHININTDKLKATLPTLSLSKPAKPPPLEDLLKPSIFSKSPFSTSLLKSSKLPRLPSLSKSILPSIPSPKLSRSSPLSKSIFSSPTSKLSSITKSLKFASLSKPKLSPLTRLSAPIIPSVIPPIIPKVSLLPLPLLPPIIPPFLPLIPPIIPGMPLIPVIDPLRPLRVPILGAKSPLQKALGSELSPVVVDYIDGKKKDIMEKKLKNLVKRGSLTSTEFERFRRLLLR